VGLPPAPVRRSAALRAVDATGWSSAPAFYPAAWLGCHPVVGSDPFADLAVPARPRRERAQSVAEASRLREEGLLLREIGARLGVSAKTVHAWLSDPEGSKARERKRRYRAICVDCGGPCYRQGPYAEAWRCETCERAHRHEHRKWTKRKVRGVV
jgi:hypothetical protein